MSQRPDTHASVSGICANSFSALSIDGERHRAVLAFTMATSFTVGLLLWLCTIRDTPAVRATALKVSSSELADAVTKITQLGLLAGRRLRDDPLASRVHSSIRQYSPVRSDRSRLPFPVGSIWPQAGATVTVLATATRLPIGTG